MRIMGVDPSIACTGVSLPDGETLAWRPKAPGDERLRELANYLHVAVQGSHTDLVVMEDVPSRMIGAAGKVIPMLHGALRLELFRMSVPYTVLSPATLKKFATGSGSADKTAMALAALKRLGREYQTSDECDADWLRIAGRMVYGYGELCHTGGVVTLPKDQLEALRWAGTGKKRHEIVWPVIGGREPWPGLALRA